MKKLNIKDWPKDERPREKLLQKGEKALSDTELLAILLRTGVRGESAIDLARKILRKFETFQNMLQTDNRNWEEFKGLGPSKIAQIKAALEIGQRFGGSGSQKRKRILKDAPDVVSLFRAEMKNRKKEIFKVVLLDPRNGILEVSDIAEGTPTECHPIIREIISKALQCFASALICLHNHPKGNAAPSSEDEMFTRELKQAGKLMGLSILDHIIFGEEDYYSFDLRTAFPYGD